MLKAGTATLRSQPEFSVNTNHDLHGLRRHDDALAALLENHCGKFLTVRPISP
jgi:hypothetical protein